MLKAIRAEFSPLRYDLFFWIQLVIITVFSFYFSPNPLMKPEQIFFESICDVSQFNLLYIVFPILSASIGVIERTPSQMVLAGCSRFEIVVSKFVRYFAVYCIASLIYPLVNCLYYCIPWFATLTGAYAVYMLRCIVLRILMGLAFASIPLIFVFRFRNLYIPLIAAVVYSIPTLILSVRITRAIMSRTAFPFAFVIAAVISVIVIAFSIAVSYLCFRRADLK